MLQQKYTTGQRGSKNEGRNIIIVIIMIMIVKTTTIIKTNCISRHNVFFYVEACEQVNRGMFVPGSKIDQ